MSENQENQYVKYHVDLSKSSSKYSSRYMRLMNILYYSKELPNDLYKEMNMSYANFRKTISILLQRGWIKKFSQNGYRGYQLTLKGKKLTRYLDFMRYADCVEDDNNRHLDVQYRKRRRQYAYLYALFDRAGIPYETDNKPPIDRVDVYGNEVFFYTALDFKRMIGVECATFVGSKLLGFLIGRGKTIPVYRTDYWLRTFGKHETLVPFFLTRHFNTSADSAILVCYGKYAVTYITQQLIEGNSGNPKSEINTAQYREFFVLADDDTFLDHYNDLYSDISGAEQRIIDEYGIDNSKLDSMGRRRYITGTGFIGNDPVLVYTGNVNVVSLKSFIYYAENHRGPSFIICKERDKEYLDEVTRDHPITVTVI